jgi:hypothetical protein
MGSYSTVWNSPGGTEEEHRRSPGWDLIIGHTKYETGVLHNQVQSCNIRLRQTTNSWVTIFDNKADSNPDISGIQLRNAAAKKSYPVCNMYGKFIR